MNKVAKRELTDSEVQDVVSELQSWLGDLKTRWDQENPGGHSWFYLSNKYIYAASKFLIDIIDECVLWVENLIPGSTGQEKKTAVLALVINVYQYILAKTFPIWLKPFSPLIQGIVILIISHLIDFMVAKYNAGYWTATPQQEASNGTTNQIA